MTEGRPQHSLFGIKDPKSVMAQVTVQSYIVKEKL